jgi:hypothetical protein
MTDSIASGKLIGRQGEDTPISAEKQTFSRYKYIFSPRSSFPLGRRTSVCSSNCSGVYFLVSVRFSFSCEILFRQENSVDLFEQCVRPGCVCVCVYVYVVSVEIENADTLITELAKNISVAEVRDK